MVLVVGLAEDCLEQQGVLGESLHRLDEQVRQLQPVTLLLSLRPLKSTKYMFTDRYRCDMIGQLSPLSCYTASEPPPTEEYKIHVQ